MQELIDQCPSCGSKGYQQYITCSDYTVSMDKFDIVQCDSCQLLYTNPRPAPQDIAKYYQSDDYISHHNKSRSLSDILYKLVRNYTLRGKVLLLEKFGKKGTLLDIGCGTGFFLNKASNAGWSSNGVEPNEIARQSAIKNGIEVKQDLADYPNITFDTITMWHVLEHIYDLNAFITRLKSSLAYDGTIFIAVPNSDSYDARHYKHQWAAYDVPRHLYHFNQNTFGQLIQTHRMKIVETIPMKFDAYYVSLLSERYNNKSITNYLSFLIRGFTSNMNARKNNNNYSSLIYVIKKA